MVIRNTGRLVAATFVAFLALYLYTLPRQFTYDGLCYALDVERGPLGNLFHPGHLFYSAFQRILWRGFSVLGYEGPAIFIMQSVNACFAAGAVAALAALLARRTTISWAAMGATFFGFSHAFWTEAADPGCYAMAALAGVALLWLLLEFPMSRPFALGVMHGGLVLWHQMLALVAPAFFWKLPRSAWLAYAAGGALGAILPYTIVAFLFHNTSLHDALYWALGPAGPPPGTPILSTYWWSLEFFPNVKAFVSALAGSVVDPTAGWSGFIAAAIVIIFAVRNGRHGPLWLWVAALSAFQFFFAPGTMRFRILLWLPLLALAVSPVSIAPPMATSTGALSRRLGWSMAVFLLLGIFFLNFRHSLWARRQESFDAERTRWVRQVVSPNDFLLYQGRGMGSILNVYLVYFAPQVPARSLSGYLFSTPSGQWQALEATLSDVRRRGGRLFVEENLLDPQVQESLEKAVGLPAGHLQRWFGQFKKEAVLVGPDGYKLFQAK